MGTKKKILIIDDEKDLTFLVDHIINSTGLYDVVIANDGHDGQQKVVEEKPDMVFLDYIMPEVRGDEVLKFIRSKKELKDVKVVIMSGLGGAVYFDDEQEQRTVRETDLDSETKNIIGEASSVAFPQELMEKYNVAGVLPKPFSREELLDIIERVFAQG